MSNSYKRSPVIKDSNKGMKVLAGKRFRRRNKNLDYLLQGGLYKKTFPQWDISDYKFRKTFKDYYQIHVRYWKEQGQYLGEPYPVVTEVEKEWSKFYRRK